ncbi:E3 ubiquitin-protein ligase ZNRF1 [Folsomia candida]|uniref:E3 ubiquitin-protein ligase ZNRF1 n=1 Tax=Folsomia candida TaxID=158441 RepID=A0A226EXC1_FOLCA|nr:E3 ubiquitin-protein ligase ZNRF1 [Folsomia candida]OXA61724.1 E3 ubiquitin-protein ligase ZNRF1 [Folsomia candida]
MGAKTSTEQRPRTFSNSEGAHNHNLTGFNHNHNSSSSSVPAPMTRGSHPFSSNGDGARGPVRGRSYSSSAMQSSSASGILELSGRINSFASGFWPVSGIRCPICNKTLLPDDIEIHLVMCLTRPRLNYNEDVLIESKDECVICLEEMETGQTIARLPCLCVYHKSCIDRWFQFNRSCPEHPDSS